ncbi:tyrosine-type recombinase/integrase [Pseudobacteroides cellulosolvens]|uniref:Tyr recombinase domain-containing protein n=1 Tax=Pseudobacteroides cellulosolvens ATCC 35603 = DSM 2933 TaxID=398512 RepID=A0A0L6JVI1_9FIRM|nr:tyrosine-type recombinase/integrase [Pseudobacteroides cellulosolvens]KNY29871.1 hypothetical protein Bccel_5148 [Pseudobacteroides cellulosolvens ATCC 35603 = DSM 2933]
MLEDYSLHKVLTRRYFASKNPLVLNSYYSTIFTGYTTYLESTELSATTKEHYKKEFYDFYGLSYTDEQKVCGIRHFLRYLYSESLIPENNAERIHMPPISKSAKIPSAWNIDELKAMISAIHRNNPIGKRDYAMIVLACVLGLRIGDIKNLRFSNLNWEEKKVSIIQHKLISR